MAEGRRYKIEGVLGKGGFGTVYRAQLLGEGGFTRKVALKVLNADMEGMEDVARRLRDEARLLGLLRHRAILHVDGLVRLQNRWTVVMEFIEGADLQKVARSGGMPLGPALEIVGEAAAALHVAYTTPSPAGVPLKLLHRDIKPPNILMTAAGEVKVLDFGIARAEFGSREAQTRSIMYGSVGYMAPERLDFEELPEGDVYALGTVLYEILVGSPFGKASIRTEKHAKKVVEGVRLVEKKCGPVPPDFSELLGSMLSYDPEDRPSAREVERRCRTLRQQVKGPFLRDWAEKAIPPLVGDSTLTTDDFTNTIVSESGGVSLLNPVDGSVPVNATMPLDGSGDSDTGSLPPPRPPSTSGRQRPAKKGGFGAVLTGLGLMGCLGVGALGLVAVLLLAIIIAAIPSSSEGPADFDLGGDTGRVGIADPDEPDEPDQPDVGGTVVAQGAAPTGYGPPSGFSVRATLQPPWSTMKLPIEPGVSSYSDDTTLVVMYSGKDPKPLAAAWKTALEKHLRVRQKYDFTSDENVVITFEGKDGDVTMSVAPTMGNLIVSVVRT